MKVLAALALLATLAAANKIEDCGLTPDAVFHDATVSPDPVVVPGPMTLTFQGDLTTDWPADVMIMVEVIKEDPFDIEVPCYNGIGSCEVDMCAYITEYPEAFCKMFPPEVPCSCSLLAGHYQSNGFTINLIDLGEAIDSVIAGGYHGNVTLYSKSAPEKLLGCVKFEFDIEYVAPS